MVKNLKEFLWSGFMASLRSTDAFILEGVAADSLMINCLYVCFQAIQNPNVEGVQEKAWAAVVPLVAKLKTFYEFSQKLGNRLLTFLHLNRV